MIISTKELIENKDALNNIVEKERALLNSILAGQEKFKSILLGYMQKLADSTENINTDYADDILSLLNGFKNSLNLLKANMDLLDNLLRLLDSISIESEDKDKVAEIIEKYNASFLTDNQTISQNTLQIEDVLYFILSYSNLIFLKTNTLEHTENINTNISVQKQSSTNDIMKNETKKEITQTTTDSGQKNDNQFKNADSSNLTENTLIISETKGKVFLPYTIKSLNDTLKNNPDKYTSIEDVIEKEYTLPIDMFKNSTLARFREGFKLIRKKEKRSIVEAFDLGMELTFKYNLHPAIICACKTLSELDLYLDYLDNKENGGFDCFKIIFDVPPVSA